MSFEQSWIARKRRSETEEEVATCKSRMFTYALSRYMRKSCTSYAEVVHHTHKLLRPHKSPTRKSRTFTYALSRVTRTDVHRTHKVASSAQAVYVRNKSLTRTSRTIRTQ